jgi:hypothetical protein
LLDQKGRKNQGKTNRSARFPGPARIILLNVCDVEENSEPFSSLSLSFSLQFPLPLQKDIYEKALASYPF